MGRAPCCDKANVKKGPWSPEEDSKLKDYIEKHGTGGNWISLPQKAGLKRCGKSCRLRWLNYLRPNIKHGEFSEEEDRIICSLFASIGSRWSIIAAQLPGRTDNDIKNYWNTKLKKKLMALTSSSSQRKPLPYPSSHQAPVLFPSSPPSQSLSSLYRDYTSFYTNSTKTFAGFDSIVNSSSIPCSLMMNNTTTSLATGNPSLILQNQEMSLLSPMQYYPMRDNLLMFGSEASCSSSDGSCSQISYGREIKQEDMGFQSFVSNGQEDQNQKFMLSYAANSADNHDARNQWAEEKPNGYYGGNPLDYGLEEVKQLISSSSSNNNNNSLCSNSHNNFFNIDENKTQEKMMYFYNY